MLNYYVIYDKQLKLANPPFCASDDKSAVRLCRNMLVSASDDVFARVAPCCDIRFIGSFAEDTVEFIPCVPARVVCAVGDIPMPDDTGGSV